MELNINYKVEFDNECIDDIMATALEGGITYWCDDAEVVGERGLDVIYQGKIDPSNIDAEDADAIIQYAIFGEVVYG